MKQHKKNILILTSRFGNGHYSVAEALFEEYTQQGHYVQILDIMEIAYPKSYQKIYNVFNSIICRSGGIYNFFNSFGRLGKEQKPNKRVIRKVVQLLPDEIITTWSGCGQMLGFTNIPVTIYITDMGVHLGWIYPWAKKYIVASVNVAEKLRELGICGTKIEIKGIPVKKAFHYEPKWVTSNKKILIMGGGLGIIPWLDSALDGLIAEKSLEVTVIVGRNQKLYEDLKKRYPTICVIGFTTKLHTYLYQADMVLSKPGGVSIFESISVGTPFVAIYPEYDQEVENANYLLNNQIGTVVWKGESIQKRVLELINDTHQLSCYSCSMTALRNSFQERIYENAV